MFGEFFQNTISERTILFDFKIFKIMNEVLEENVNYINLKNQQLVLQNEDILLNSLNSLMPVDRIWNINTDKVPIYKYASEDTEETCQSQQAPMEITAGSSIFLPNEVLLQLNLNNINNNETVPNTNLLRSNSLQVLDEHIEIVNAHKCKTCGNLYERYDDVIRHIKQMHNVNCKMKVEKIVKQDVPDDETEFYLCGQCDDKSIAYESISQLEQHMITMHNFMKIETNLVNIQEDDEDIDESHFKKLLQNQKNANKKVKCMIKGCDNSFAHKDVMLKHMECHVEGMKKRFKCLECDKLFFIWRTCKAHMWKAHQIDIGLFECSICKCFKSLAPYDLLVHMKTHGDSKAQHFLCSICGGQFDRLCELQNHSNTHATKKNWDVNCLKCDRNFANNKYLKRHIQCVHDQYKPFICNICGHKCARKSMLELHLRQHTGEKPYKCELCNFKTGDHNSFRRHVLRHSGLTNYACPHCEYTTIQSCSFKLHMKRKHPGKPGYFTCSQCAFSSINEKLFHKHVDKHKNDTNKNISETTESGPKTNKTSVPNVEDEETQIGLFPDHVEDTVDTGGITIPATDSNL